LGNSLWISDVSLTPASPADVRRGLVGFVSVTIDGVLRLDGLTLRRTRDGRTAISLPRKRGRAIVRPLTPEATRSMEQQILAQLGLEAAS